MDRGHSRRPHRGLCLLPAEDLYFESVQNDMNFYWSKEEVLNRLDEKMTVAFNATLKVAEGEKVFMRDAAYMVSIGRVVKAMELRGWL